ncbi:DNA polymerase III subunit beta [uncultured Gammaproteobacteria bacterium]
MRASRHRSSVGLLLALVEDAGDKVNVVVSRSMIRVSAGYNAITSKVIDGEFPDYGRIIPAKSAATLSVDADDLAAAALRVGAVTSERGHAIKLTLSKGTIVVSAQNLEGGTGTDEIDGDYRGVMATAVEIGINSRYLADVLGQISGEVEIGLGDEKTALAFRSRQDPDAFYLVMPVRV